MYRCARTSLTVINLERIWHQSVMNLHINYRHYTPQLKQLQQLKQRSKALAKPPAQIVVARTMSEIITAYFLAAHFFGRHLWNTLK